MEKTKRGKEKKARNSEIVKRFPPLIPQSKSKSNTPDASQFTGQILDTLMQQKNGKNGSGKRPLTAGIKELMKELASTGSTKPAIHKTRTS